MQRHVFFNLSFIVPKPRCRVVSKRTLFLIYYRIIHAPSVLFYHQLRLVWTNIWCDSQFRVVPRFRIDAYSKIFLWTSNIVSSALILTTVRGLETGSSSKSTRVPLLRTDLKTIFCLWVQQDLTIFAKNAKLSEFSQYTFQLIVRGCSSLIAFLCLGVWAYSKPPNEPASCSLPSILQIGLTRFEMALDYLSKYVCIACSFFSWQLDV